MTGNPPVIYIFRCGSFPFVIVRHCKSHATLPPKNPRTFQHAVRKGGKHMWIISAPMKSRPAWFGSCLQTTGKQHKFCSRRHSKGFGYFQRWNQQKSTGSTKSWNVYLIPYWMLNLNILICEGWFLNLTTSVSESGVFSESGHISVW